MSGNMPREGSFVKPALVLTIVGLGVHVLLITLSHLRAYFGGDFLILLIFAGIPFVTSVGMLTYAFKHKASIGRIIGIWLVTATALFLFFYIGGVSQDGVPTGFTMWKFMQLWFVNLILWAPLSLAFGSSLQLLVFEEKKRR